MANITPGYDFAVNETPNRDTFLQQARGLQISAVALDELEGSVRATLKGDTSGATGALQDGSDVGTVWIDARGNVWVREAGGDVRLWVAEGGWESRRYFVEPSSAFGDVGQPGVPITDQGGSGVTPFEDIDRAEPPAANTVIFTHASGMQFDDTRPGRMHGFAQATAISEFARWSGRGGTQIRHLTPGNPNTQRRINQLRNELAVLAPTDIGATTEIFTAVPYDGALGHHRFQAWASAIGDGASIVSQPGGPNHLIKVAFFGWHAGAPFWTNRD